MEGDAVKADIEYLHKRIAHLTRENERLHKINRDLTLENADLKAEVAIYRLA